MGRLNGMSLFQRRTLRMFNYRINGRIVGRKVITPISAGDRQYIIKNIYFKYGFDLGKNTKYKF